MENETSKELFEDKKYPELIDYFLEISSRESEGWALSNAWYIAQKYVPYRKMEIAGIVAREGNINDMVLTYTECVLFLGYKNRVKNELNERVIKLSKKLLQSPRFYQELVQSLQLVGLDHEISLVIKHCESYISKLGHSLDVCEHNLNVYKEMSRIYLLIGDKKKVKNLFEKIFDYVNIECDSDIVRNIYKEYVKMTGDTSLEIKLLPTLGKEGNELAAADLCRRFGLFEKARYYEELYVNFK